MAVEGIMLPPGAGETIADMGATLKVAMGPSTSTSSFEVVIGPGYDVGAHVHNRGEEVFFVLEGEVDLLAFEPADRSVGDWHEWVSAAGRRYLRGGPGAFMHVPAGVPHAFANRSGAPVRMFFQSSVLGGHENYFRELADLLRSGGPPDQQAITSLRERYDTIQLTRLQTRVQTG